MTGPTGLFFNFGDAAQRAGDAPMLFWLARRYDDAVLAVAAREAATGRRRRATCSGTTAEARPPTWPGCRSTPVIRTTHLAFFRSAWNDKDAVYVGFKGGDNAANHAHLDLGTFVLDALGQRWAMDLGPDDYDLPGYFGAERWTYERLKTSGQNTLMLNGASQDLEAAAPLTAFRTAADGGFAITDLTAAYAAGGATRVQRGISLRDSRSRVLIQDEIETTQPVELTWTMHTQAVIELQGDRAILSQGGSSLEARILAPAGATFSVEELELGPPQQPAPGARRLLVRLPEVTSVQLAILFVPRRGLANAAAAVSTPGALTPGVLAPGAPTRVYHTGRPDARHARRHPPHAHRQSPAAGDRQPEPLGRDRRPDRRGRRPDLAPCLFGETFRSSALLTLARVHVRTVLDWYVNLTHRSPSKFQLSS